MPVQHQCPHCSREFSRAEHLVRHKRIHTREKPFNCKLCDQKFSRRDLLRRHETKTHKIQTSSNNNPESNAQALVENQAFHEVCWDMNQPNSGAFSIQTQNSINMPVPAPGHLLGMSMEEWTNPIIPNQEIDLTLQKCLLPSDLGWLDQVQLSQVSPRSDMSSIVQPDGYTIAASDLGSACDAPSVSPKSGLLLESPKDLTAGIVEKKSHVLGEEQWKYIQEEAVKHGQTSMPDRHMMQQYIRRYFITFHRHQPFLHEPTWSPNTAAIPLVMSVCANGALYSLEYDIARNLFSLAVAMLKREDHGLWVLQTLMPLTAFAAWSGKPEDLFQAVELQGRLILNLRHEWARVSESDDQAETWEKWLERESLKRISFCAFTVTNLMAIGYDIPSHIYLEDRFGLPCDERQWKSPAYNEGISDGYTSQQWLHARSILQRLAEESLPPPQNVGVFTCHLIISSIVQKILLHRKLCVTGDDESIKDSKCLFRLLQRWQIMWENEPESSLTPDHPQGPILFNCTALLRLGYVRLMADYSPVRASFGCSATLEQIQSCIGAIPPLQRGHQTTRAALHACLALRIPVQLGLKLVSRTSFWVWSVQHALCYFECALFLAQWLQIVQDCDDILEDEQAVLDMARQISASSRLEPASPRYAVAILNSWAQLLDTRETTVWRIMPIMADVLSLHANMIHNAY